MDYGIRGNSGTGFALFLLVAASLCASGCANNAKYATPARFDNGLVIILPGIEGPSPFNIGIRDGLIDGGLTWAVLVHDWHPRRMGAIYAFSHERSRRAALDVARSVDAYRRAWPGRPVVIVGHSGGAAIAVFAAEALKGEPLTGIIALAPALGPDYDLSVALSHTRMGIVSFNAPNDYFLKTIIHIGFNFDDDRRRTAGADGFAVPSDLCPAGLEMYQERLKQFAWKPSMLKQGNWGGHFGWTGSVWVAHNLVLLLESWADGPVGLPPLAQSPEHTFQ